MSFIAQRNCLMLVLTNVKNINARLAQAPGWTKNVFSTPGDLSDNNVDNARNSIGLEFQALVQNIRGIKPNDPILQSFPDIHYNLSDQLARRNWLACEYGTTAPVMWKELAISVYEDVPKIEVAIVAALESMGISIV